MTKSLFSQLDVIYVSSCSCYYSSLFLNRSRRGGGHRAQVRCSEFESHQSPQLFCNVVVEKNTNKQKEALGQWLWLSWQRGHFQHQRFMVRIHPSSNFYIEHLFTINCNEKTKIKIKRPGIANFLIKNNKRLPDWPVFKQTKAAALPTSRHSRHSHCPIRLLKLFLEFICCQHFLWCTSNKFVIIVNKWTL